MIIGTADMNVAWGWLSSSLPQQPLEPSGDFSLSESTKWMALEEKDLGHGFSSWKVCWHSLSPSSLNGPSTTTHERKFTWKPRYTRKLITYRASFLTEEERIEVERRLKHDRTHLADEFDLRYAMDAFKDWKIYVHMLITIGIYTPLYSVSLFLPT